MNCSRNARLARIARRAAAMTIVAVVVALMSWPAYANTNVLPPGAQPHGTSRTQMAQALAPFTFSGNDSALLPETPFQVLYGDPATIAFTPDGSGVVESGSNAFTVQPGMSFFVPVFNVDDSPPVIGTFPTTTAGAQRYLFDPAQLGGRDFQIVIDGTTTPLGPSYVAGPVTTAPLPDGGGTHAITLGAFLSPLTPGTHTVTIGGGIFGALVPTIGVDFLRISFTYQITVAG
jgi:hypothetical protein